MRGASPITVCQVQLLPAIRKERIDEPDDPIV
jgi:hypothetical protein